MVAAGLAIIYLMPRVTKVVPSPLVAIVVLTAVAMIWQLDVRRVGDLGTLPSTLPIFLWPQMPLTFATLWIILPYSLAIAAVGLLESLMTAQIVDDLTDTPSNKKRESAAQGIANFVAGLFGGMAGCRDDWPVRYQHQIRRARPSVVAGGWRLPAHPARRYSIHGRNRSRCPRSSRG